MNRFTAFKTLLALTISATALTSVAEAKTLSIPKKANDSTAYVTNKSYDGGKYTGYWKYQRPNGKGILKSNGITQKGTFKNGLLEGNGVEYGIDYSYEGQFRNGQYHGEGVLVTSVDEQDVIDEGYFQYGYLENGTHGDGQINYAVHISDESVQIELDTTNIDDVFSDEMSEESVEIENIDLYNINNMSETMNRFDGSGTIQYLDGHTFEGTFSFELTNTFPYLSVTIEEGTAQYDGFSYEAYYEDGTGYGTLLIGETIIENVMYDGISFMDETGYEIDPSTLIVFDEIEVDEDVSIDEYDFDVFDNEFDAELLTD